MSPSNSDRYASVWYINQNGGIYQQFVVTSVASYIRPVINLKADVTATGTGTSGDPYVIQ